METRLIGFIVILLCCGVVTHGATGAVSDQGQSVQQTPNYANVTTEYPVSGEESQAVQITVAIENTGDSEITDVRVDLTPTDRAYPDYSTIEYGISARDNPLNATHTGGGTVIIEPGMEPGEEVNISLLAYPKVISEESLTVGIVTTEYVQRGQQLSEREQATADFSESYYFQLQDAENQVQQLRTQIQGLRGIAGGGAAIGILGLLAAGWFYRSRSQKVTENVEDIISRIDSTAEDIYDQQATEIVRGLANNLREEYDIQDNVVFDDGSGGNSRGGDGDGSEGGGGDDWTDDI